MLTLLPLPARVVLVEDDPATALLTATLLEADGIEVTVFATAEDARQHLSREALPDVVLSDLMLPGETGLDLVRWLRSDPARASLPILLISSATERQTRLAALNEGADDLLSKPVDPIELRARVQAMTRLARARAQLAVRDQLDAVVSQVSDGVVVLGPTGSVVSANARATQLLDLPDTPTGTLHDHLLSQFEVAPSAPSEAGGSVLTAHRPRKDREGPLWLTVTVLPIPNDPRDTHVAVVRDITDQRLASDVADLVLSAVAHKFRTPLTGIVSATAMLSERFSDGPQAAIIGTIERAAQRLDGSLGLILEHASALAAGSGDANLVLSPDGALDTLATLVNESAAIAITDGSCSLDVDVLIDADPVRAAIEEFVQNANEMGAASVRVSVERRNADVVIAVEDDGPGIPPEDLGRVFSPFFQVDRTGQQQGMGLGLPLVRHLATRADGAANVSSGQGKTRFEITLPLRLADDSRPLQPAGAVL